MGNRFKSGFVTFIIFSVAVLLMATLAYAQASAALPPCSNGVQDGNETGVDCGGSCALIVGCEGNCTSAYIVDYCDGKDNDKDCLVDEDCKPQRQPVAAPKPAKPSPCYNGELDSGEEGIDCGGTCFKDWMIEACDSIDNDRDCLVDEGGVCDAKANGEAVSTRAPQEDSQSALTQTGAPEPAAVPQPMSAPEAVSAPIGEGAAAPAPSIPAEKAPSSQPALADGSSALSQKAAATQKVTQVNQAKESPQSQSIFAKVRGFFKRMLG